MNDAEERFVRRYAHLPPDAPLDRHAARALLGEFINRYRSAALSDAPRAASLRLASRTLRALDCLEERDRWATLEWLKRGVVPSARILRRLCEEIDDA